MEPRLLDPKTVSFDSLFLDPNNPRLAPADPPGYADPLRLFNPSTQKELEGKIAKVYDVPELRSAIVSQGWIPMDAIVVWEHPVARGKYLVVEGNTRVVALRLIREDLERDEKRLAALRQKGRNVAEDTLQSQEDSVARLKKVVASTNSIRVVPMAATDPDQLEAALPRVLGVRHLTGAKPWAGHARAIYVLRRYEALYRTRHPGHSKVRLESDLIEHVSSEVSLSTTEVRRALQAANAASHFRAAYEDRFPGDDPWRDKDFYIFELAVKSQWLSGRLGMSQDDLHFSPEGERAIFTWAFAQPNRGDDRDDNQNIFYRLENMRELDKMRRYDDKHGTAFAARFDFAEPDSAPKFATVESEWLSHKARKSPMDVIQKLADELDRLEVHTLRDQAEFLKPLIRNLVVKAEQCIAMIEARPSSSRKSR